MFKSILEQAVRVPENPKCSVSVFATCPKDLVLAGFLILEGFGFQPASQNRHLNFSIRKSRVKDLLNTHLHFSFFFLLLFFSIWLAGWQKENKYKKNKRKKPASQFASQFFGWLAGRRKSFKNKALLFIAYFLIKYQSLP